MRLPFLRRGARSICRSSSLIAANRFFGIDLVRFRLEVVGNLRKHLGIAPIPRPIGKIATVRGTPAELKRFL